MLRLRACALVAVVLALAAYPAHALAPLVILAKQLAQQVIKDFVEGQIDNAIRASFGPCKFDLAEDAIQRRRALTAMLPGGVGGPAPNIAGLANLNSAIHAAQAAGGAGGAASVGNLANLAGAASAAGGARAAALAQASGRIESGAQAAAQAANTAGQVSNAAGQASNMAGEVAGATSGPLSDVAGGVAGVAGNISGAAGGPAGSVPAAGGSVASLGELRGISGEMPMNGMPTNAMPMGGMPNGMDMQAILAKMQMMMQGPPLSPAEFDDLVTKLERWGKVSDAVKPGSACSADDYRRLFGRMSVASGDPRARQMSAGMMRMIYSMFQDMEQNFAHSAELFAQMSPADRAEYVDSLSAELKNGPPENRRAFLAMLDNGLIQPPEDVLRAFHQRLAD